MTLTIALRMNRGLKNIGWDKSAPFIESGMKNFIVRRMNRLCKTDGKRKKESVEDMVMRLQQTFFVGADLPVSGQILLRSLTVKEEESVRIKTEEDEAHHNKLRMAPDSTMKRSLDEINSEAGKAMARIRGSAKKMRRTGPDEDAWTGFTSPRGSKQNNTQRNFYKTPPPPRHPAASDDLDDFGINPEIAGTGRSKGYKPYF